MRYPSYRPRRLRQREPFRRLIRETRLSVDQLVMPVFVRAGKNIRAPIPSIPGQFQLSVDQLVKECQELREHRVPAVLLFGMAPGKDEKASHAYAKDGILQEAIHAVKASVPELMVITDVCLCAYLPHGHCGVLKTSGRVKKKSRPSVSRLPAKGGSVSSAQLRADGEVRIDHEATLELLTKTAVSHAQAGADMVAPSDMMDGRVGAIRGALDDTGFAEVPILSYAAKFASSFYAPFREAVASAPAFGDRKSYQLDVANAEEALREAALDIEEGADIVMVKPALAYLDVIYRIKQEFHHPVAAFSVSGEYAMVKAASAR
ncbi:MAG: porphobilinogen synthase, partial [Candidatus Omnitrophica bacterium]|nr:porphobilinogen synthase [Candidatus Omnitrophota bacterium]